MTHSELHKVRQEETQKAELSNFWQIIAENLPKNIERAALGDEKIFRAFNVAYPQIRKYLSTQTFLKIAEGEIKRLEGEKKQHINWKKNEHGKKCVDGCTYCCYAEGQTTGWNAAKDQDIAYWQEEIKKIK